MTSFPATVAAIDVGKRVSLFSFKANWAEMAAGQHDNDVRNLVNSIPEGHLTYLCWFHEPENDGTASAFVPAFRQFATVAKGVGKPHVKVTLILMSWTWNPASGRNPSDWWPGAEYVDAVGLDGYNSYNGTNKLTWKAVADIFQTPTDWLRAHGAKEIGIAECGCREHLTNTNAKADLAARRGQMGRRSAFLVLLLLRFGCREQRRIGLVAAHLSPGNPSLPRPAVGHQ